MNRCTTNETISRTPDFTLSISNASPRIDLWRSSCNPRILQLLPIGKIAQALQSKGDKELLGGDEGIGGPSPGRKRCADHTDLT